MNHRPIIGREAPLERQFLPRRLSDINPHAWLDTDEAPAVLDVIVGRVCAVLLALVLLALAVGWL